MSGWLALALASGLALPQDAAACGPCACDGESGAYVVFPGTSDDVPTNARFLLWAPEHDASEIRLVRGPFDAREVVESDVRAAEVRGVFEVRAKAPLDPGMIYSIEIDPDEQHGRFRARDEADTTPPVLGAARSASPRDVLLAHCGDKRAAAITLVDATDDAPPTGRWLARIEIEDGPTVFARSDIDDVIAFGRELSRSESYADCLGAAELGSDAPGGAFQARVVLIDEAGNESEPVTVDDLRLSPLDGPTCPSDSGGCSTAPSGGSRAPALLAVALGGLGLARRRMRGRRRREA